MTESFMKSAFFGVIAEGLLFPYPEMNAAEVDQLHLVLGTVRKLFASSVDSKAIDREQTIPKEVIESLKALGLCGMLVPQTLGGVGFSASAYARVMQEIGGLDASVAVTLGAHQSIGYKGLLLFGTDEQKQRYLPRLATGEMLAAFALTEPGAGSDAAAIRTHAALQPDGSYRLSGSKILDHQRRLRGPLHGLCTDVAAGRWCEAEDHGLSRRTGLGRQERAERAQARHPRQLDHGGLLR